MNRIERMKQLSDVRYKEFNELIQKVKELAPRIIELNKTYDAAKQYNFCVHKFEVTPSYKDIAFRNKGDNCLKMYLGNNDHWYIDYKGDIYTSTYGCHYTSEGIELSDVFRLGYGNRAEVTDERISALKGFLHEFMVFELQFYKDIDKQLTERENCVCEM